MLLSNISFIKSLPRNRLHEVSNAFNLYWFSPARKLGEKEKEEASYMLRGPPFFQSLSERFPKGQVLFESEKRIDGLLLSLDTSPEKIEVFPSQESLSSVEHTDEITLLFLSARVGVARSLLNTLRGSLKGEVFALFPLRFLRSLYDEKPSPEEALKTLHSLWKTRPRLFSPFIDLGFVPAYEGVETLKEGFTADPLSFGYVATLKNP